MKTRLFIALALVSTGFGVTALVQGESAKPFPNEYQILLNRSIFSREPVRRERPGFDRTKVLPDLTPVLTGVVQDEDDFIAFLEDPRTGKVTLARTGLQLPQGTIEEITLTDLTLRPAGATEPRHIEVGRSLAGNLRIVTAPTPASSTGAPSDTAATAPAPAATAPGFYLSTPDGTFVGDSATALPAPAPAPVSNDPAERLRQRRLRELQGGK